MEDGFRLQDTAVAIVGLGLMGGSLAMALKGKCAALYGIDSDPATLKLALDKQIVDNAGLDAAKLLPGADLIILATPVPAILSLLAALPRLTEHPCIVLDLGSTKSDILQAMAALPPGFDPIGGHPICGKEKLGLEHADPGLYRGAPFIMAALNRTSERARSALRQIVSAIDAHLIEINAEDHDRILAATSHLPFLLSSALAQSTPHDFASYLGTGFASVSRLAGTPSHMMMGVLQTNRTNILNAIQTFHRSLDQIETALQNEDYPRLNRILDQSRAAYQLLISNP